jgi:hypothetical protein
MANKKAFLFLQKKKQKNSHVLGVFALASQTPTMTKSFLPPAVRLLFFRKEAIPVIFQISP